MGSWGVDVFENDDALDIKSIWDDFIPRSKPLWHSDKIYSLFKKVYFKGALPAVTDGTSSELIGLAQLFEDNGLDLPKELEAKFALAIAFELSPDKLEEWGQEKNKRAKILNKIAEKYSFKIDLTKFKKENSNYQDEIDSLTNWFEGIERVNSLLDSMSLETINWVESIKPEFIQHLEDKTWRFEDESDEDKAAELSNLRYLAVIWFAFFNLKYKPEEIMKIIELVNSES